MNKNLFLLLCLVLFTTEYKINFPLKDEKEEIDVVSLNKIEVDNNLHKELIDITDKLETYRVEKYKEFNEEKNKMEDSQSNSQINFTSAKFTKYGYGTTSGMYIIKVSSNCTKKNCKGGLMYNTKLDLRDKIELVVNIRIPYETNVVRVINGFSIIFSKKSSIYDTSTSASYGYETNTGLYALKFEWTFNGTANVTPNICFQDCINTACRNVTCYSLKSIENFNLQLKRRTELKGKIKIILDPSDSKFKITVNDYNDSRNVYTTDYRTTLGVNPYLFFMGKASRGNILINSGSYISHIVDTSFLPVLGIIFNDEISRDTHMPVGSQFDIHFNFPSKSFSGGTIYFYVDPWVDWIYSSYYWPYPEGTTSHDGKQYYMTLSNCTTAGKYTFIYYSEHEDLTSSVDFYLDPLSLYTFNYYGHDNLYEPNTVEADFGENILKFGEKLTTKDFILSEFNEKKANINFQCADEYGNILDVGSSEAKIIETLGLSVKDGNEKNISFNIQMMTNTTYGTYYSITFDVTSYGDYVISSTYFLNGNYKMKIYSSTPTNDSSCEIANLDNKDTLKQRTTVTFKCTLYDNYGQVIDKERYKIFNFTLKTILTDPSHLNITVNLTEAETTFDFAYSGAEKSGVYKFIASYSYNGEEFLISSKSDIFTVLPEPETIKLGRLYSFSSNEWYDLNSSVQTLNFNYADQTNRNIYGLDLEYEPDNKLFSEIGLGNVDTAKFSAEIGNEHNLTGDNYTNPEIVKGYIDSQPVLILRITENDKKVFRRSSYPFFIKLKYNEEELYCYIKFDLTSSGGQGMDVCHHDLDISNSNIDEKQTEYTLTAGETHYFGKLYFRTKCNKLYNYDEISRISYTISPQLEQDYTLDITSDAKIEGTYDISLTIKKSGTYNIQFTIDDQPFNNSKFKFNVNPIQTAYTIDEGGLNQGFTKIAEHIYQCDTFYTADDTPVLNYSVYDKYGNIIEKEQDYSNLGISLTVTKDDEIFPEKSKLESSYLTSMSLTDKIKNVGKFNITLRANEDSFITFIYTRKPGEPSAAASSLNYISAYRVVQGTTIFTLINIIDKYSNIIDELSHDEVSRRVKVYAQIEGNNASKIDFNHKDKYENFERFKASSLSIPGEYIIHGSIDGTDIINLQSNTFYYVLSEINLESSIIIMISDKIEYLNKNTNYNIRIKQSDPIFHYLFYNYDGQEIFDKDDPITLSIELSNQTKIEFELETFENSSAYYRIPNKNSLAGETGKLLISDGDENNITFTFLDNDDVDFDKQSECNYEQTYFSKQNLTMTAGNPINVIMEFRTTQGKRCAKAVELKNLTYSSEQNQSLSVVFLPGQKLGQVILEISQTLVNTFHTANKISISYNNQSFNKILYAIVSPSSFNHFIVEPTCIQSEKQLNDATVGEDYSIILYPKDVFGNAITELFDSDLYTQEDFHRFFYIKHELDIPIDVTSTTVDSSKIKITFSTKIIGKVSINSKYLTDEYYLFFCTNKDKISKESTGYVLDGLKKIKAGSTFSFIVVPRDEYGNKIEVDATVQGFKLNILKESTIISTLTGTVKNDLIVFEDIIIDNAGTYILEVSYNEIKLELTNNLIIVENSETTNLESNDISKCYFVNDQNQKLTELPNCKTDSDCKLRVMCYDKDEKQITITNGNIFSVNHIERYINQKITIQTYILADGSIKLKMNLIYKGDYTIDSVYFENKYQIVSESGEISYRNSFIEIAKEHESGNDASMYVYLHDYYGNAIDADVKYKDSFIIKYQYQLKEDDFYLYSDLYDDIEFKAVDEDKNALEYKVKLVNEGTNIIYGLSQNTKILLKCKNCYTTVNAGTYTKISLYQFDFVTTKFKKMLDSSGSNYESNTENYLILRLYPTDDEGNIISETESMEIQSAQINGEEMEQTTEKGYIELRANSSKYQNLGGNEYKIIVNMTDGKSITVPITLYGDLTQTYFTTQTLDISKTKVINNELYFEAGGYGSLLLQLRTQNNVKYYDGSVNSIEVIDCNNTKLNTTSLNLNGLLFIKIGTTVSNTYPVYTKCSLEIKLNEALVSVQPNIAITPCPLNSASIPDTYIKSGNELKDITADDQLEFEIAGFDKYHNVARVSESKIRAAINLLKQPYEYTSNTNIINGYQYYYTSLTVKGSYLITAGKNSNEENLLGDIGNYSLLVKPGKFSSDASEIKSIDSEILAGNIAKIRIQPKDSYGNQITTSEISSSFNVTITNGEKTIKADVTEKETLIEFNTNITQKGDYSWKIMYQNTEEVPCYNCLVNVSPNVCDLSKLVLICKDENGDEKIYSEEDKLYSNVNVGQFEFYIIFRDTYENEIDNIDEDVVISDIKIEGNDMEGPINFGFSKDNTKNRYIFTMRKNDSSISLYNRIITFDSYPLNFTIKVGQSTTKTFNYNVNHIGKFNSPYGNGFYSAGKSKFDTSIINSKTGIQNIVSLYLMTDQECNYTGSIDPTDITVVKSSNLLNDPSITYTEQTGKYQIYITQTKVIEGSYTFYIKNPSGGGKSIINSISINITVNEPNPEFTSHSNITSIQEGEGKNAKIKLWLKDSYENDYKSNDLKILTEGDCLTVYSNGQRAKNVIINVDVNENCLIIDFYPTIVYANSNVNVFYKASSSSSGYDLLKQNVNFTIIISLNWDYTVYNAPNLRQMTAGDYLQVKLKVYDSNRKCYDGDDHTSLQIFAFVKGPLEDSSPSDITYQFEYFTDSDPSCNYGYELPNPGESRLYTKKGTYSIKIYATYLESNRTLKTASQTLSPGEISNDHFVVTTDREETQITIKSDEILSYTMYPYDKYNNLITNIPMYNKVDSIVLENGIQLSNQNYSIKQNEKSAGQVVFDLTIFKLGSNYSLSFSYLNNSITPRQISENLKSINVVPGSCESTKTQYLDISQYDNAITGVPLNITIQCVDYKDNIITQGGEDFTQTYVTASYESESSEEGTIIVDITSKITDNGDGKYILSFTPPISANYSVYIRLGDLEYGEKSYNKEIKESSCTTPTPIQCPNNLTKCVDNILECIDPDERGNSTTFPFKCNVGGFETCVSSRSECDCQEGYIKCGYHGFCVPEGKEDDLCPSYYSINCETLNSTWKLCYDGICRENIEQSPSQRVCPIGSVLCPDLTCRSNLNECEEYTACSLVKCQENTCTDDQGQCPSSITCTDASQYVCPDGECVTNEIYCKRLPVCSSETPFLCANSNTCATDHEHCPTPISCGHGNSLCSDNVCRFVC